MDPNANLQEQLELITEAIDLDPTEVQCDLNDEAREVFDQHIRLCGLVEALNEWIRKGGFLPDVWREGQALPPRPPAKVIPITVDELHVIESALEILDPDQTAECLRRDRLLAQIRDVAQEALSVTLIVATTLVVLHI